jgi:putative iron-regulated protein
LLILILILNTKWEYTWSTRIDGRSPLVPNRLPLSLVLLTTVAAAASACGDSDDGLASGPVVERYAALVHDSYADSLRTAEALQAAADALVAAPSPATLAAARTAWKAAREPYGQTETFRFYGGPIDDADGPEGEINSWPLNEAHIDYVVDDPAAGIVNSPAMFPTIDAALLSKQNQLGAEDNVAAGYHAIEFLLWGQDLSATGPGERPHTDYLPGGTAQNQGRRGEYLKAATSLLVSDLRQVAAEWEPGKDNYAGKLVKGSGHEAITNMLNGMYRLAALEMKGERLQTGYDEKTQEQEHSCFSDNTKVDFRMNILGVENVYLGRQGAVDGAGLDELVKGRSAALDEEVKARLTASKAAMDAIPEPYDQAILAADGSPERMKIKAAIDSLQALGTTLGKVAQELGVTLDMSAL